MYFYRDLVINLLSTPSFTYLTVSMDKGLVFKSKPMASYGNRSDCIAKLWHSKFYYISLSNTKERLLTELDLQDVWKCANYGKKPVKGETVLLKDTKYFFIDKRRRLLWAIEAARQPEQCALVRLESKLRYPFAKDVQVNCLTCKEKCIVVCTVRSETIPPVQFGDEPQTRKFQETYLLLESLDRISLKHMITNIHHGSTGMTE